MLKFAGLLSTSCAAGNRAGCQEGLVHAVRTGNGEKDLTVPPVYTLG